MMTTLIKVYGKGSPCTDQVGGRALSLILQTEEIDADDDHSIYMVRMLMTLIEEIGGDYDATYMMLW